MNFVKVLLLLVCWSVMTLSAFAQRDEDQVAPKIVVEKTEKGGEGGHSGEDTVAPKNPRVIEGTFSLQDMIQQAYKCTDELANSFFRQFTMSNPKIRPDGVVRNSLYSPNFWEAPLNEKENEFFLVGSVAYDVYTEDNHSQIQAGIYGFISIFAPTKNDNFLFPTFAVGISKLNNSPVLFEEFAQEYVNYTSDPKNKSFSFPTYKFKKIVPDIDKIVINDRGAIVSGIEYTDVEVTEPSEDKFLLHCDIYNNNQTLSKCTKLEINALKFADCLNRLH